MFAAMRMATFCSWWILSIVERRLHYAIEADVNILRLPEQMLLVLHPFEVRHRDAARVAQHIRDHKSTPALENSVILSAAGVRGPLAASAPMKGAFLP